MTYQTQQEKDSAIAALKAQLAEAEKAPVSGRWKPKEGEMYWIVNSDLNHVSKNWENDWMDKTFYKTHNVFASLTEAQAEADKTLIWREFRAFFRERNGDEVVDWKDGSQDKWGIDFEAEVPSIECHSTYNSFLAGCAFVGPNAEANAHAALEKFGDRLHLLTTP